MSDTYQVGDLIEAVKGDTIIRDRLIGDNGSRLFLPVMAAGPHIDNLVSMGYKVTVIEKAKPKVELPSEPGIYVSYIRPPSPKIFHKLRGGEWVDADDAFYVADEKVAEWFPLTRLEPRAVTAKAVLDEVGNFAWADGFTTQIEAVAKKFGVGND